MRWRTVALVIGCLALVLLLPGTGVLQGKGAPGPIYASATFGDAAGDKIQSDNGTPYVTAPGSLVYLPSGRLVMDVDAAAGARTVSVLFDDLTQALVFPNCRTYGATQLTYAMDYAPDLETPESFSLETFYQFKYENGTWAPVIERKTGRTTYYHYLNLFDLKPGNKAYVQVVIRLWVASTNDGYDVNLNNAWDLRLGWNGGIFEVVADPDNNELASSPGDKFHFRQLPGTLDAPLGFLGLNEANLRMWDQSDSKRDVGGYCNMGNFRMPFSLTVTRK